MRFPVEYYPTGQTKAMADARIYLENVARSLGPDVNVETATYYEDPAIALVNEATRRAVDLVVMSTHGHTGLGSWIYGSIAEQVFRHVDVPVLVVSPNCVGTLPADRPPRILVPLDGSELAEKALEPVTDLARALGAPIHLARVVPPPTFKHVGGYPDLVGVPRGVDVGEAESYLETVAARLHENGIAVTMQAVEAEGVARSLSEVAEEQGADVIAMSTHGRGGVARLVMGSVASGIVQEATVPILLFRPATMRQTMAQPRTLKSAPRTM
jgi:nucleotide-binding universal stress UspA family protein